MLSADCWIWGNGDSNRTNESGSFLVGRWACPADTRGFCSALAAPVGQVQNIFFPQLYTISSLYPHRPASWASSRAGLPVSYDVSSCTLQTHGTCPLNHFTKTWTIFWEKSKYINYLTYPPPPPTPSIRPPWSLVRRGLMDWYLDLFRYRTCIWCKYKWMVQSSDWTWMLGTPEIQHHRGR